MGEVDGSDVAGCEEEGEGVCGCGWDADGEGDREGEGGVDGTHSRGVRDEMSQDMVHRRREEGWQGENKSRPVPFLHTFPLCFIL